MQSAIYTYLYGVYIYAWCMVYSVYVYMIIYTPYTYIKYASNGLTFFQGSGIESQCVCNYELFKFSYWFFLLPVRKCLPKRAEFHRPCLLTVLQTFVICRKNCSVYKRLAFVICIRPFDMQNFFSSKVCFYCTTNSEPCTIRTNLG